MDRAFETRGARFDAISVRLALEKPATDQSPANLEKVVLILRLTEKTDNLETIRALTEAAESMLIVIKAMGNKDSRVKRALTLMSCNRGMSGSRMAV